MQFLAILAFSLVAGYSFQAHVRCTADTAQDVYTLDFKYPFSSYSRRNGSEWESLSFPYRKASSGAQLFVAWGVLSMLYTIVALVIYMLFTANEQLEKVVDCLVYTVSLGGFGRSYSGFHIVSIKLLDFADGFLINEKTCN